MVLLMIAGLLLTTPVKAQDNPLPTLETISRDNVDQLELIATLDLPLSWTWDVDFSPNGTLLAISRYLYGFTLWDLTTGQEIAFWNTFNGLDSQVKFSPDGSVLALVMHREVWVLDMDQILRDTQPVDLDGMFKRSPCNTSPTWTLAFHPSEKILASGSDLIQLCNLETGKIVATFHGADFNTSHLTFSPDGNMLAIGQDHELRLWNLVTQTEIGVLKNCAVWGIAFGPDGSTFAFGDYLPDGSFDLWHTANLAELSRLEDCLSLPADSFSPDGSIFVRIKRVSEPFEANHRSLIFRAFNTETGEQLTEKDIVSHFVKFNPEQTLLAVGNFQYVGGNQLELWGIPAEN